MADKDPLILDFRNGRVLDGADLDEYDLGGLDDGPANWDDIDLEGAFDLPPALPAELESERADIAWLIADTFGPFSHFDLGQETFPFDFAELRRVGGLEKPDEVFEAMARLDHPDAEAVLTMIGRHASDKTTAKAARRAAYTASTRRAARR